MKELIITIIFLILYSGCTSSPIKYDVIIRNGTIYDGSGGDPIVGDIAINNEKLVAIGDLKHATGNEEIDATGMAVAPGFINVLSWAVDSLIEDGLSQGDIRQGVTLEVFGEGESYGPLNEKMKQKPFKIQEDIDYEIQWTTLSEYLEFLVKKGVSTNVASFVGAGTIRIHELGYENREPTSQELQNMRDLVAQSMEDGALGLGSALIYVPDVFAKTDEKIELAKVVARYDGLYISHIRNESNRLLEAVDELITIARKSGVRAEIYHLKAAGQSNWNKMEKVFETVEAARAEGLEITADMYTYIAAATGLDAAMPPWVQEGGYEQWVERLKDPEIRERIQKEMTTPQDDWENLYLAAGSAENVLLVGFKNDKMKYLTGKTLADVAKLRGKSPELTAMDLVIEDGSRVSTVYFVMSEDNIRKKISKPWVSFGSDETSSAPVGVFLKSNPHPRAYGNFSRLLGRYVRDQKVISLTEAIRRLTSLPASNLKIKHRGSLKVGNYADVVIFNPKTIQDHATFEKPHQYSTGVHYVFVNGVQVLKDGEHTGATPGQVVRGPGWKPNKSESEE